MEECIFCRIARGEIDSSIVYEDENLVAFNDINPQAPMHVLIIPRMHVSSLLELGADGEQLVGKAHRVAGQIARERADGRVVHGIDLQDALVVTDGTSVVFDDLLADQRHLGQ